MRNSIVNARFMTDELTQNTKAHWNTVLFVRLSLILFAKNIYIYVDIKFIACSTTCLLARLLDKLKMFLSPSICRIYLFFVLSSLAKHMVGIWINGLSISTGFVWFLNTHFMELIKIHPRAPSYFISGRFFVFIWAQKSSYQTERSAVLSGIFSIKFAYITVLHSSVFDGRYDIWNRNTHDRFKRAQQITCIRTDFACFLICQMRTHKSD